MFDLGSSNYLHWNDIVTFKYLTKTLSEIGYAKHNVGKYPDNISEKVSYNNKLCHKIPENGEDKLSGNVL